MSDNWWKNKRVLVTGGTGFLGKHLADVLLKEGAFLYIVDFRKPNWQESGVYFHEADIREKERINELCLHMDIVFHLAAMPSIARGKFTEYHAVNVEGTRNILEASLKNRVKKFVYVSSSTVYGIPKEFPLKETSPLQPVGKYGRSKLEAENLCRDFKNRGLSISIIRPRVIIGAGRIGIFSILFDRIINNKPIYIIGKGNNVFQFTHVLDMVSACIKAAEYEKSDLFNIGSEDTMTVNEELLALIQHAKSNSKIISTPPTLARFSLKFLSLLGVSPLIDEQFSIADKNFKLDTSYACKVLNWHPAYSNLESLIQAYDWYVDNTERDAQQYKNIFGIIGKFRHTKMGGFSE